jgi:small subunit ribosomal protein S17
MAENHTQERGLRRTLTGIVTSSKMANTITVQVQRTYKHPKYGKYMRKNKKYHAHDEAEVGSVGDKVEIVATRPYSKIKRWRLLSVLEKAPERGVDVATAASIPSTETTEGPKS